MIRHSFSSSTRHAAHGQERLPSARPDVAFAAMPLLERLLHELRLLTVRSRTEAPRAFFFHRREQVERTAPPDPSPLPENLVALLEDVISILAADRDARRCARVSEGLSETTRQLVPRFPRLRELHRLLNTTDDEIVRVMVPDTGHGVRVAVQGIADLQQFYVLLMNVVNGDPVRGLLPVSRARPELRLFDDNTEMYSPEFQMMRVSALQPNGTLPGGLTGTDHWLWGRESIRDVELVDGERTLLLGTPAYRTTWELHRPRASCEIRLIETLSAAEVANWLESHTGTRRQHQPQLVPATRAA